MREKPYCILARNPPSIPGCSARLLSVDSQTRM